MSAIHAYALSDIGRKRQHNEDAYYSDDALGLFVVCDGMGGHAAGEVASALAVDAIRRAVVAGQEVVKRFAANPNAETREQVSGLMEKAIQQACAEIYKLGQKDHSKRGMGTTCVALLASGRKAVVGHVGDSRVYLYRNNRAHQLTEDHTIIQEQLKRGIITKEQALTSEVRNVITRAVGIQQSVAVDTLVTDLLPGDMYLLCSDGLHGYLADDELPVLMGLSPPEGLPAQLVEMANQRGGKDNITALVVSVGAEEGDEVTDVEAKTEMLRRIPLFQHMSYKELLSILGISRGRQFPANAEIIREGENGDELFVVFRGRSEVVKNGVSIAQLKPGAHFGEMGLVDQAPRSATIRAVDPVNAISLDRESLLKLMRKDSLLAVKLLWSFTQVLSERLRGTNDKLTNLKGELDKLRGLGDTFEVIEETKIPPPPPFGSD